MFKKYTHIERFGNDEVQGIGLGDCTIFPKIDGTNGSIWAEKGVICAGSRNRILSAEEDNAGFYIHVQKKQEYKIFFNLHPYLRLYGEWLVPHSLKTYIEDAWRRFYVFDVYDDNIEKFLSYQEYQKLLVNIDYIPAISILRNSTYENLLIELQNNKFLIKEGEGFGEGIVIKNYNFQNCFGRLCFAKIISNQFKEKHQREMGPTVKKFKKLIEQEIVDIYINTHLIEKTYAKIVNECRGWNSKYIPRLFNMVFYDLINEELWDIIKKMKQPVINFKTLFSLTIVKIKKLKPELF